MANQFNARWGIMATGRIARNFVNDLLIDPTLRGVHDITHNVTAVASSSSREKAAKFIGDLRIPAPCNAYGSYEELVADPDVDIVYVATPHSHHFQNVMLALHSGKHVLCEKAFTVNAAQAIILCQTAKEKNLFLMEAVWTRYFPLSIQVRELIQQGEIGEVLRVIADTSFGDNVEQMWGTEHRMVNMDLAGGALLDIGIYSLTWVFQTLYHTLPPFQRQPPSVISGHMTHYPLTGADEATTILLTFPTTTPSNLPNRHSQAVAMTHLRVSTDPGGKNAAGPAIRIQGTKGEIQIDGPSCCPKRYRIIPSEKKSDSVREIEFQFPGNGEGYYWEADEAVCCMRDGKLESQGLPWEESIIIMKVMDEVRRQGGLTYPANIESTVWPIRLRTQAAE